MLNLRMRAAAMTAAGLFTQRLTWERLSQFPVQRQKRAARRRQMCGLIHLAEDAFSKSNRRRGTVA